MPRHFWFRRLFFTVSLLCVVLCSRAAHCGDSLVILPSQIKLTGPEARQTLLVELVQDGQITGQISDGLVFQLSDPSVVTIEDGIAIPRANGKVTITAKIGTRTATAELVVEKFDVPHQWSFRNHVQSVFSKAGCNSGACHGALAGKNGFRLSLRGYDPETDFRTITRQSRGRRIVPKDPGRSLLLTKPTGLVPHKGGLRFRVDSREFRVIAEWIASGHPAPRADDPRLDRLEILPQNAVLKPGVEQQLVVQAHFTDGHTEDVTRWAKYTSTNLTVANVDDRGHVKVTGSGEGAIVAWYLSNNVIGTVSVPYPDKVSDEVYAQAERNGFIDDIVLEKLKALNLPPSPIATDAKFLRRAYLDTIGVLPTVEEARAFLLDVAPDKRERLADQLLSRIEFVDYWSYKWSDLLLVSGKRLRPEALKAYSKWIRQRVEENTPWNEFAAAVVTAKGGTFDNGAANFYSLHQDPPDMAETFSTAFLGMSIQCARCHNHPLEKWTNDDYYGMVSLFARVRGKGWGGDFRSGDGNRTIFTTTAGEIIQPRTGKPQPPRPLNGQAISLATSGDRRAHLVEWMTSPKNPYFARAIVNRVWANFLGTGIVEKVDDLRLTNPASNERLLTALAERLRETDFDLKALMRLILTSKTYQRTSRITSGNGDDQRFYARFYPRRLKAEVLLDAISQATDVPTKFKDHPLGTRAMQLADSNVDSLFLKKFGRPERVITCECERSDEPSMVQVLHITNGDTINVKLADKNGRVANLLAARIPNYKIVEEMYLSSLSRFPTDAEIGRLTKILQEIPETEKQLAAEDLFWSILSSKEFLFNH